MGDYLIEKGRYIVWSSEERVVKLREKQSGVNASIVGEIEKSNSVWSVCPFMNECALIEVEALPIIITSEFHVFVFFYCTCINIHHSHRWPKFVSSYFPLPVCVSLT